MKINKIIMEIGIVLIVVTLLLCFGFTNITKLKSPVFFRYCIETQAMSIDGNVNRNPIIQLQYITNIDDTRKAYNVTFDELPQTDFMASEYINGNSGFAFINNGIQFQNNNSIGRYSLHTIYLFLDSNGIEKLKDETELNTAHVCFSNGSILTVDIGRIILYRDNNRGNTLTQEYASTTKNGVTGSTSQSFTAKEDITLHGLKSPILDAVPKSIEFKINGSEYDKISEVKYRSGQKFGLDVSYNTKQFIDLDYDVYDIRPKLIYDSTDKASGYIRIFNINWERNLYAYKDILSYLHKRGAF